MLFAVKKKFSVSVLGFCIMSNHFHVVMQPEHPPPAAPRRNGG